MNGMMQPENQIAIRFAGTGTYSLAPAMEHRFGKMPFELFLCAGDGSFSLVSEGKTIVCGGEDVVLIPYDSECVISAQENATVIAVAADARIYTNLRILSLYHLLTMIADAAPICRLIRATSLESEFTNRRLECAMTIDRSLYDLFDRVMVDATPRSDGTVRLERYARLAPALSHIGANIGRNFTQNELSELLTLSEDSFYRLFKSTIGEAPKEYLISERMRLARFLLLCTDLSISEITRRIGYESPFYFSTLFRSRHGMPPSEYRERGSGIFN